MLSKTFTGSGGQVLVVVHDNPLHKYMYTSTSRRWSCSAKPDRGSGGWLLIEAAWAKVVAELEGVFAGGIGRVLAGDSSTSSSAELTVLVVEYCK